MSFVLFTIVIFILFFCLGVWIQASISSSAKKRNINTAKLEQDNRELRKCNAELTHEIILLRQAMVFNLPVPSIESYEKEQERIRATIEQSLKDNNGT